MQDKTWLATRKTGIGGTDAAAIMGMSPWKSPMQVWLEKRGLADEREDPDKEFLLQLGQLMEPVITDLYERQTQRKTVKGFLTRHSKAPILLGTPDRICVGEPRGVELKTENQFTDQFGDPGTDQVPDHYLVQCVHYMAVCDLPIWDVAVLHGGVRFSIYTIERDMELEDHLIESLLSWWEKHIVHGVPPELDSSDAWRVYLHKKYPSELLPMKELESEYFDAFQRLANVRHAQQMLEVVRDETENKFKSLIGDHTGVSCPFGQITWKKTKESKHVDWEGAYYALKRHAVQTIADIGPDFQSSAAALSGLADSCLAAMTTIRPGVRRFLFTPKKGLANARGNNVVEITGKADQAIGNLPAGEHIDGAGSAGESTD